MNVQYCCPSTREPLSANGEWLLGGNGDTRYPIRSHVAVLLQHESAESAEDRQKLARLNELADERGCVDALREVYGETANIFGYVTDTSRQAFIDLLPIDEQSRVLEIGSGLGQFTPALAARCAHVCAIEVVEEQAAFTLRRCIEAGRTNVSVAAGGDECKLPYPDESFDGVVLNLVLEWCGMRGQTESFPDMQRRMLGEIRRVLRPGGFVFISTKNRYALRLLLGKRDGHAHDMRFGHALPRWLMTSALRAKGHSRPSGWLYSHRGFKRLLRDCGFGKIEPYWAAPNMRRPQRYIPANARAIRAARRGGGFSQGDGRIVGRVMRFVPAPLIPHLAYGNVALAHRE